MKTNIFLFIFICISFSAKSQIWEPKLIATFQKYFIVPVDFESFGKWVEDIENDSTLIFTEKSMTLENDSIYLNFVFKKVGFSSPFENSNISAKIFGRTREFKNLSTFERTSNSVKIVPFPYKKQTTVQIMAIITFDSTSAGKELASKTQKLLEDEFHKFFAIKTNHKAKKSNYISRYHPEVIRAIGFTKKKNVLSGLNILNSSFPDRNQVSLSLLYELNNENIDNTN